MNVFRCLHIYFCSIFHGIAVVNYRYKTFTIHGQRLWNHAIKFAGWQHPAMGRGEWFHMPGNTCFITSHTLVWKRLLVSVFFLCPVTDISATTPIGVKFCMMVHIGPGEVFSPFEGGAHTGAPESDILGLSFGHLTANISKTVSRSVTCQLKLNISATRAF